MTEIRPTVYESADIAGLQGEFEVRMTNGAGEPELRATSIALTRGVTLSIIRQRIRSSMFYRSMRRCSRECVVPRSKFFTGETAQVSVAIVDAAGTAVSLAGRTLRIVIEPIGSSTDQVVIEDGSIARSGNTITFAVAGGTNGQRRNWSLRDVSASDVVLAYGVVSTSYAPKKD
ncbi:MAG: hypothetical protein U0930_03660 [Pirellulales bacterium]